jgi:signal transduction histidine kinase
MQFRHLALVGVLTWAIVAVPHVYRLWEGGEVTTLRGAALIACLVAFATCFVIATRENCERRMETMLVAAQSLLALACFALRPGQYLPVLLVIVSAELSHLPFRGAVAWIAVQTAGLLLLAGWSELFLVMTYFAFQLFAAVAALIAEEERRGRLALAEANAELQVATGLLEISSRTEERLRIARDVHDLIGHHLTALSLNLEVASHQTSGPAREQVEKAQALTKLLLSDVRDTVGRLREQEPVDLTAAMQSLSDVVRQPAIHVETANAAVTDPAVAQTALRVVQEIVTNAVRHSGARNLWLKVLSANGALSIDARDDGVGADTIRFGNGLYGMRERVAHCGGTLDVQSMRGRGFELHVRLPLARSGA